LDCAPDWDSPPLPPPPEWWHDGNKSGRQVKAKVTKRARAMVMATRVVSCNDGNGNGGKSDGNDNKGGR
jgi:hypothetical protein